MSGKKKKKKKKITCFNTKHKIDHSECDGWLVGFQIDPNRKLRPVRKEKKKKKLARNFHRGWFGLVWFGLIDVFIYLFEKDTSTKREKESPPHQTNLNKET